MRATSTLGQDRAALGRVPPAPEVRAEHDRLATVVDACRRDVERTAASVRRGTTEDRTRERTELSSRVDPPQTRIAAAIGAINTGLRE